MRDLSIKQKLYALVAGSTLGVALVLALACWALITYRINGPVYEEITVLKELQSATEPASLLVRGPYLTLWQAQTAQNAADLQKAIEAFRREKNQYLTQRTAWLRRLPEGPFKQALEVDTYQGADELFRVAERTLFPLLTKEPPDREQAAKVMREQVEPGFQDHSEAVARLVESVKQRVSEEEQSAAMRTSFWVRTMLIVSVLTVIGVGLLGLVTARSIVRSTGVLLKRVREMAGGAGDLTARVEIDSNDEIGHLARGINAVIAKIHAVVRQARESSVRLLSAASQIAATTRQQEATVHGLSSSTTEIAASVREISATSRELAGTMDEVTQRANQASALAESERADLSAMEATMQQLVDSTASISAKLGIIREKADSINVVVTTITKVADQTNLLSINAAIEAEKAGEYGRGFLVVAREIRRLADQTAVATLDIANMVRLMQDAVSAGVMQMDKFGGEVREGVARVAEINAQTGKIIEDVQVLSTRFRAVNEGMRQQSLGADQINDAMGQLTAATRQTQASLVELNQTAADLRSAVEGLNGEIGEFRV